MKKDKKDIPPFGKETSKREMVKEQQSYKRMALHLLKHYSFEYNEVLNRIEYRKFGEHEVFLLDDYKLNSILGELLMEGINVHKSMLVNHLYSKYSKRTNPFIEYFEGLPSWQPGDDDYIQALTDTVIVSEEQRKAWTLYLMRWLIASVGCAIDYAVVNQQVLVLIGEQGIGKTRWIERLVPNQLSPYYFSGNIMPGDKDSCINLAECFIINLDELSSLNRGNLSALKGHITQSSVRIRRPYAALAERMPRRASFIGSVNSTEFLRDETGSRRFLCIEALSINHAHSVNMNMVYAQAYYLFTHEEKHWFDGNDIKMIEDFNKQYKMQYPEMEYVNQCFVACDRNDENAIEMTLTQLHKELIKYCPQMEKIGIRTLGMAMKASDYTRVKKNGSYYYRLRPKDRIGDSDMA